MVTLELYAVWSGEKRWRYEQSAIRWPEYTIYILKAPVPLSQRIEFGLFLTSLTST